MGMIIVKGKEQLWGEFGARPVAPAETNACGRGYGVGVTTILDRGQFFPNLIRVQYIMQWRPRHDH